MLFGCNQNQYDSVSPYVSPITMQRSYKALTNTWPVMTGGGPSLWSSKPNPDTLLAGGYDETYNEALATAPPGSMLSAWWECDKGPNGGGLSASVAREVHTYLHALVTRYNSTAPVNGPIPYGSVLTCGLHTGNFTVPGLDFYGVDAYDIHHDNHPAKLLNAWSGTQPVGNRVIAETNTSVPANRPYWFTHAYGWLLANRGLAFLTFWNLHGSLSGPFLPSDTATIKTLNQLAAQA